jgi:hypothetical protein
MFAVFVFWQSASESRKSGRLGVLAILLDEPGHRVTPTPAARFANEKERRLTDIGQSPLGHPVTIEQIVNECNGRELKVYRRLVRVV